jgi:hypothetical protein
MIRLLFIVILLSSCKIETYQGKKIRKLLIDEKLEEMLQVDVNTYMNDYCGEHFRDTMFILITQKIKGANHLRFYANNEIIDTFNYFGYFYCNDVLFLFRDTGANDENLLALMSKSEDYRYFSTIRLKPDTSVPTPDDIYYFYYVYEHKILRRAKDYYQLQQKTIDSFN